MAKILIVSLISISCVIQLTSVAYNFNLEFIQNPNHHVIADNYVWDWSQSHLRKRFENIIGHITGNRSFSPVKVMNEEPTLLKFNRTKREVQTAYCVNFFPFKAKSMSDSRTAYTSGRLFYLLLCVWLALLVLFWVAAFKLIQFFIRQRTDNLEQMTQGEYA